MFEPIAKRLLSNLTWTELNIAQKEIKWTS